MAWKVALIGAAALLSPRAWTAIRTWQRIKAAQTESERDIEKKQRKAAERDVSRLQLVVKTFETERSILQQQAEAAEQRYADIKRSYEDSISLAEKGSVFFKNMNVIFDSLFSEHCT